MTAARVEAAMTTETITAPLGGTGRLMTLAEVAHLFRVDPRTVTRWAKAGRLTAIRTLGYGSRFLEDEVHELLNATS